MIKDRKKDDENTEGKNDDNKDNVNTVYHGRLKQKQGGNNGNMEYESKATMTIRIKNSKDNGKGSLKAKAITEVKAAITSI